VCDVKNNAIAIALYNVSYLRKYKFPKRNSTENIYTETHSIRICHV